MKELSACSGCLRSCALPISLATRADSKTMTMTGWISDNLCGAKGASVAHKACGATCMKTKGRKLRFS